MKYYANGGKRTTDKKKSTCGLSMRKPATKKQVRRRK